LGAELRRRREAAGVTIDGVAEKLECSASKISRIETGQSGVSSREVRDILAAYQVEGGQAEALVEMAREAKQRGWWQLYGTVLTSAYVGLEAAAAELRSFEPLVIPGLLQTEAYARAMVLAGWPNMSTEEVEQRIRVRMKRQSLLYQDDPLQLSIILDEAALRRPVGGIVAMRRQLTKLLNASELPHVTVQVLPLSAGAHGGMDGAFTILLFEEQANQNLVFAANGAGGLFLEKDDEIERYAGIFAGLQGDALSPARSIEMIATLAKEP
jgi:transcriptional regulator with XRE-family HTH domain